VSGINLSAAWLLNPARDRAFALRVLGGVVDDVRDGLYQPDPAYRERKRVEKKLTLCSSDTTASDAETSSAASRRFAARATTRARSSALPLVEIRLRTAEAVAFSLLALPRKNIRTMAIVH
jgi:hypothetical protein